MYHVYMFMYLNRIFLYLCFISLLWQFFRNFQVCNINSMNRQVSSLRSKRFQSSYSAKVRAGAKQKGRGRGRGEEETLARKPHDSGKRPLIFYGSVDL